MMSVGTQQLLPISAATLIPGSRVDIDIYACAAKDSQPFLFLAKSDVVSIERLEKFQAGGVFKLFVASDGHSDYQAYLRNNLKEITENKDIPLETRTTVLSEVSRDVLGQSFRDGRTETIVSATQSLGQDLVSVLGREQIFVNQLFKVLHHDYATFTHSVNVACFATLLAKGLGYSLEEQTEIATGGLLHDLGKLSIDDRILRKQGKLDDFEWREIQKHPVSGFRQLAHRSDLSYGQLMMVYQHHEKLDGSGYPVGVVAEDIHPWARICAIVDIFEALTAVRPYRSPMEKTKVLAILDKEAGKQLDPEMVKVWSRLVTDWKQAE